MSRVITSLALAAAALLTSAESQAFEIKHTPGGEIVSWRRDAVAWVIDPSVKQVEGAETAARNAAKEWSGRAGAPTLSVTVSETALTPGVDGKNAILYSPEPYAPAGIALAVTVLSYDDSTGEVIDADIVINGKYRFAPYMLAKAGSGSESESGSGSGGSTASDQSPSGGTRGKGASAATYDIGRVLAHEMGHGLALSDEPGNDGALMFPYVARATALAIAPTDDDLSGVGALYGPAALASVEAAAQPETHGCAIAQAPRAHGAAAFGPGLVAAGLGIAALALFRSKRRGGRGAAACSAAAAFALVVLPPAVGSDRVAARAALREHAIVTSVRTTSEAGVFRTDLELAPSSCRTGAEACAAAHTVVWGGTLGGVRQVVAGVPVPAVGESFDLRAVDVRERSCAVGSE